MTPDDHKRDLLQVEPPPAMTPPPATQNRQGVWGWLIGAGVLVLSKLKFVLLLLKAAKFGKLFLTMGTMVLSIWAYGAIFGLPFAAGFVGLILIHELGHGVAIKARGLQAGWPVFIPFFGAMISLKGQPRDADEEAFIAYGGPLAGTAAGMLVAAYAMRFHSPLAFALAETTFFLNLFNMIPLGQMDGGRIAKAFSKRAWIVGGILMMGLFVLRPSPQLAIIAIMGAMQAFRGAPTGDEPQVPDEVRRKWQLRYFGLVLYLGLAMYFVKEVSRA